MEGHCDRLKSVLTSTRSMSVTCPCAYEVSRDAGPFYSILIGQPKQQQEGLEGENADPQPQTERKRKRKPCHGR